MHKLNRAMSDGLLSHTGYFNRNNKSRIQQKPLNQKKGKRLSFKTANLTQNKVQPSTINPRLIFQVSECLFVENLIKLNVNSHWFEHIEYEIEILVFVCEIWPDRTRLEALRVPFSLSAAAASLGLAIDVDQPLAPVDLSHVPFSSLVGSAHHLKNTDSCNTSTMTAASKASKRGDGDANGPEPQPSAIQEQIL